MSDMTSVTEPTAGDVLRRAAEVLRERGHCKGALRDEQGRVCLLGAIEATAAPARTRYWAIGFTDDESLRLYGITPSFLWNNAPERTQAEVEKFLLHCADRADFPDGQS